MDKNVGVMPGCVKRVLDRSLHPACMQLAELAYAKVWSIERSRRWRTHAVKRWRDVERAAFPSKGTCSAQNKPC